MAYRGRWSFLFAVLPVVVFANVRPEMFVLFFAFIFWNTLFSAQASFLKRSLSQQKRNCVTFQWDQPGQQTRQQFEYNEHRALFIALIYLPSLLIMFMLMLCSVLSENLLEMLMMAEAVVVVLGTTHFSSPDAKQFRVEHLSTHLCILAMAIINGKIGGYVWIHFEYCCCPAAFYCFYNFSVCWWSVCHCHCQSIVVEDLEGTSWSVLLQYDFAFKWQRQLRQLLQTILFVCVCMRWWLLSFHSLWSVSATAALVVSSEQR